MYIVQCTFIYKNLKNLKKEYFEKHGKNDAVSEWG